MIRVDTVSKRFPNTTINVLEKISFSVNQRDSLAILGPSGCGKTTLLYILSGLIQPTSGYTIINNNEITGPSKEIAFILQDFGLLPWKTVWDNVCLGMKIRGIPRKIQNITAERLLEELGLNTLRNRYPAGLSGGEKQRVAIARALALEPEILLMDEPFSSLDTLTREKLQQILLKIWQAKLFTMIIVTHSIEEAVYLGKRIMILGEHPGTVSAFIDNPEAGELSYRTRDVFFAKCKEVRQVVTTL